MAGRAQQLFVSTIKYYCPGYFSNSKVLEIGSCDINGSIRSLFGFCEYIGVDICEGPSVDLVKRGEELDFPSCHFDMVVSCQCFEHNIYWPATLANMIRMLRPGGLCIITCATIGMFEHGTRRMFPSSSLTANDYSIQDYYMNLLPSDLKRTNLLRHFGDYIFFHSWQSGDLFL